jgi:hypothetical protein
VEIFTSHLHSVHDAMTEVDGCLTPDAAFLGRFPQAFDATSVCSGVHAPGMTDLTIHDAYRWLRAQVLVPFHVCDAGGDPAFEITSLGRRLNLRLTRCIKTRCGMAYARWGRPVQPIPPLPVGPSAKQGGRPSGVNTLGGTFQPQSGTFNSRHPAFLLVGASLCRDSAVNQQLEAFVMILKQMLQHILLIEVFLPNRAQGSAEARKVTPLISSETLLLVRLSLRVCEPKGPVSQDPLKAAQVS